MKMTIKEKQAMNRAELLAWTVFSLGMAYLAVTIILAS